MQYCFLFFSSYFWLCWVFNAAHGLFVAVSVFYVLVFWLACGILASQPGREPAPTCIGRRSLNPWTTREVLSKLFFKEIKKFRREKNTLLYVHMFTISGPLFPFVYIHISVVSFSFTLKNFLGISLSVNLLLQSSFGFCLSENVFISLSFLLCFLLK